MRKAPYLIEFVYPVRWRCAKNPAASGINEGSRRWAHEMGFIRDEEHGEFAKMRDAFDGESWAGLLYPTTGRVALLQLISDWTLWVLLIDDYGVHEACRTDASGRQELLSTFSMKLPHAPPSAGPFERAFHDLVRRFRELAVEARHPEWMEHLDDCWSTALASSILEETKALTEW